VSDLAEIKSLIVDSNQKNETLITEMGAGIHKRLDLHQGWLKSLWRKVHGSDPPPANINGSVSVIPSSPPLDEQVEAAYEKASETLQMASSHDLDIHGIKSQLVVLQQGQEKLQGMNSKQNERQGVDAEGISYLFKTRDGRKFVLSLIAAVTGLLTAGGTIYAVATGKMILAPEAKPAAVEVRPALAPAMSPSPSHAPPAPSP